jgi:glycerol uptake facilitator-like aquaporin
MEICSTSDFHHQARLQGYCTDESLLKFIELVGTMSLCYISALIHITIGNLNTSQVAGYVGVSNLVLLTLFIYAISPASGGHINPIITFSTITAGLTGFPRGFLYMAGQTLGAAIAGGLVRGSFGDDLAMQSVKIASPRYLHV